MDKSILILALETLLEQLVNSRAYPDDFKHTINRVQEQINIIRSTLK